VCFDERITVGESDKEVLAMGELVGFNKGLALRGGTGTKVLSAI
jgi:hypothetical protein